MRLKEMIHRVCLEADKHDLLILVQTSNLLYNEIYSFLVADEDSDLVTPKQTKSNFNRS